MSVRQIPQAETSISTSPGPGRGIGRLSARSPVPGPSHTIASICAGWFIPAE
jgi:hypothetical protein